MEQEFHRKCCILCLDVPKGTEFGIDLYEFQTGDKFRGIKLIPPGIHFIYYAARSKYGGSSAPRTGFFLNLKSGEVIVKRWNPETEDFFDQLDETEAERFAAGVERFEFDEFLGPYDESNYEKWKGLSNFITPSVLSKLEPVGKKISEIFDNKRAPDEKKLHERESQQQLAEKVSTNTNLELRSSHKPFYSHIELRHAPKGSTPQQVTKYFFDKSSILMDMINQRYNENPSGILGEIQFSFIAFLLGHSYDSFEQWKQLIQMLTSCDDAIYKMPELFSQFIDVLRFQSLQVPADFFVDILSGNNFLEYILKQFLHSLNDSTVDTQLISKAKSFREFAEKRFSINFEEDEGEDAPVVVDMNQ